MSFFTDFTKIDLDKYYYDEASADMAVEYIEEHCFHVKGSLSGTRFILSKWQKDRIVKPIFGWKHIEETLVKDANGKVIRRLNKRKYRKAYIEIPKKNGKSTLLAAIVQIFMDIEAELGSEIVGVAWGRKQASIIFNMVQKSIAKSPRMKDKITWYKSTNVLLSNDGEKRYSVWSKEAGAEDGQFPQLVIIDELHEHKNGDIVSVAEKSMMGRINPLALTITTAGSNLTGIGYQRREHCEKVAQGSFIDESQLVCIYCADKKADIWDKKTWYDANPQLGLSISLEDFKEEVTSAKVSAANENAFKRYFLNIWNNSRDQWISSTVWDASQWDYDIKQLEGRTGYMGIDLSSESDVTAVSIVFPIEDGKYISLNYFFLPEHKGQGSIDETTNMMYAGWIKNKYIIETPGNSVDYEYVIKKVLELCDLYDIRCIAADPWNSSFFVPTLQNEGKEVVLLRQGFQTFNEPSKAFFGLLLDRKFNHLGNPVLAFMNGNTSIVTDAAGNIKPTKEGNKIRKKIDGIVSNIMALRLCLDTNLQPVNSYLETGDLYSI